MLDKGLTDHVLKGIAKKLSKKINDKWEALGCYLNVDKNTLFKLQQKHSKTRSKVYAVLKAWRNNTPDASQSQLDQIISEFKTLQQPMEAVSRNTSSSSASSTLSKY